MLRLENFQGQQIEPYLDALGALRITVFRDFPYLYDGNLEYERDYLQVYLNCPRSLAVLAFHGAAVVGATTCIPLADESAEFREPLIGAGYDPQTVCYFGESLLLPQYRGRGIGKQFFKHREKHALSLGLSTAAFCSVDRASNHPQRPISYKPLDDFWSGLGYEKRPGVQATFTWKEVGEEQESPKTLTFWTKELGNL